MIISSVNLKLLGHNKLNSILTRYAQKLVGFGIKSYRPSANTDCNSAIWKIFAQINLFWVEPPEAS